MEEQMSRRNSRRGVGIERTWREKRGKGKMTEKRVEGDKR